MAPNTSAYVLAFESTHAAMEAISALERGGVPHAVIPTPRAISAGCGMSLRFSPELFDAVRQCLDLPDGAPHATLYCVAADGAHTPYAYGTPAKNETRARAGGNPSRSAPMGL